MSLTSIDESGTSSDLLLRSRQFLMLLSRSHADVPPMCPVLSHLTLKCQARWLLHLRLANDGNVFLVREKLTFGRTYRMPPLGSLLAGRSAEAVSDKAEVEVLALRDYVPVDDGWEPTDFDGYYDVPAQTTKDVATRIYIKVERDPKKAVILEKRQNEAIIELLKWPRDYRAQLADQERASEDFSSELPGGSDPLDAN